jgi:uncharacterized MAPEG superfamily protein
MAWVDIVGLAAVVQLFFFGIMVGSARAKYGVAAPATTGHPMFERYYRVQMNSLENLVIFLPALWLAAKYWSPKYAAALGAVYLVGRMLYYTGYISDPKKRGLGFSIGALPMMVLIIAGLVGAALSLYRG